MFSDNDKQVIQSLKEKIEEQLRVMAAEPWVSGVDLPWDKIYLSGGATVSLLHGEKPKDFDFYFEDMDAMYTMRDHLVENFKDSIADVDPKYAMHVGSDGKMITSQAITMKNGWSFIIMAAGKPEQIRRTFDYVHCKPYYSIRDRTLFISEQQFRACMDKKLIVNNTEFVKSWRTDKFIKRGFKCESIIQ